MPWYNFYFQVTIENIFHSVGECLALAVEGLRESGLEVLEDHDIVDHDIVSRRLSTLLQPCSRVKLVCNTSCSRVKLVCNTCCTPPLFPAPAPAPHRSSTRPLLRAQR